MRDERGPWYLLTGFVFGAVLGLLFAWVVAPVEYVNTSPASLRENFKDQYRALIAAAYAANSDLARAQARLDLLNDRDVARTLAEQAQRNLAEDGSPDVARALALLALDLGQGPTPVGTLNAPAETQTSSPSLTISSTTAVETQASLLTSTPTLTGTPESGGPSPSPGTEEQTPRTIRTSLPTGTPLATRTPTATPGALFVLQESTFVCDPDLSQPLIQVLAEDAAGKPVPGVEVVVNWEEGEDHFFTGLKPELGLGYADFTMNPGTVYTLRLVDGGQPISDLTAAECEAEDGSRYWGSWYLLFAQPGR